MHLTIFLISFVCNTHSPMPGFCHRPTLQEENATVWARYSSTQFDQGAARHACNNPYNVALEDDILENAPKAGKINCIAHKDFLDLVAPSFGGVEDIEDSAAILARTHLIVLTEKGVYWRLAGTGKEDVPFTLWPENESKYLLVAAQKPIFKAYKKDPAAHTLPSNFHEDCVWSQELLRKVLSGEVVPRTITIRGMSLFGSGSSERHEVPRLLPRAEMQTRVKQEQVNQVFRNLKRPLSSTWILLLRSRGIVQQALDPDSLPGMDVETDGFPAPGERDDLEVASETEMESMMTTEEWVQASSIGFVKQVKTPPRTCTTAPRLPRNTLARQVLDLNIVFW